MSEKKKVVIVVHGGAWKIPDSIRDDTVRGVERAVRAGYEILRRGGDAADAVEAAVVSMEDDTVFDAGMGSVLNEVGNVEMDALICDGKDLSVGSCVGVSRVKNPIRLARLIKDKTQHVMFSGKGAEKIAAQNGMKIIDPKSLVTDAAKVEWERFKRYGDTVDTLFNSHDTVGAVAMDIRGSLASATSTGGITAKKEGRVGDSPICGSGGYADNDVGATSLTGHGESILRTSLAMRIMSFMQICSTPTDAAQRALEYMKHRVGGCGGVICMDTKGNVGIAHTTERMAWACIDEKKSGCDGKISLESGIRYKEESSS
eukprot:g6089.t1